MMKLTKQFFLISLILISGCTTMAKPGLETQTAEADDVAKINVRLGLVYLEKEEYERSLNKLKKAIQIDPDYPAAHNAIAILYTRLNEDALAETHYQKAIQLNANDSRALNNYGQFLCSRNRQAEAQQLFERAINNPLYQTPEVAFMNAGICAVDHKDLNQADVFFRKALSISPEMPQALIQMAELNYIKQQYLPARAYLERYAAVAKHSPRTLWAGVRIEKALGDVDAEANYALRLKNNFPDSQETRLLLEMEKK